MNTIKLTLCLALLFISTFLFATSATTRNILINGPVTIGAANGTNGNDWELDEACPGNDGVTFYYTFDDVNLYLGWTGGDASQQHLVWIDTDPQDNPTDGTGSTTTFDYGGITASLPFTGNVFLNIESAYDEIRTNSTGTWSGGAINTLSQSSSGDNLEVTVPWASIGGKPTAIYILSYLNDINGNNGNGFVYGGAPTTIPSDVSLNIPASDSWYYSNILAGQAPNNFQGVLPVELLNFNGTIRDRVAQLRWETASEWNNDYFDVERSSNGYNWQRIGSVQGLGTSSLGGIYEYQDDRMREGINYYRLKQVDFDGKFECSHTISLNNTNANEFMLFPNPAVNALTVAGGIIPDGEQLQIQVIGLDGKVFQSSTLVATANALTVDVSLLQKGHYFLLIYNNANEILFNQAFIK